MLPQMEGSGVTLTPVDFTVTHLSMIPPADLGEVRDQDLLLPIQRWARGW